MGTNNINFSAISETTKVKENDYLIISNSSDKNTPLKIKVSTFAKKPTKKVEVLVVSTNPTGASSIINRNDLTDSNGNPIVPVIGNISNGYQEIDIPGANWAYNDVYVTSTLQNNFGVANSFVDTNERIGVMYVDFAGANMVTNTFATVVITVTKNL